MRGTAQSGADQTQGSDHSISSLREVFFLWSARADLNELYCSAHS